MGALKTQVCLICKVCKNEFQVVKCREFTAITCSRECRGKIDRTKYSSLRIKKNCLECNRDIEVTEKKSLAGYGKYCSVNCHNIAMTKNEHKTWAIGNEIEHSNGYILVRVKDHPHSVGGYIFKHRLKIERLMRRFAPNHEFMIDICGVKFLKRLIHVHHVDSNKKNNKLRNLIACTSSAHQSMHHCKPVMEGSIYPDYEWIQKKERQALIDVKCMKCSKEFTVYASKIRAGRSKFCSNKCRYEARKGHSSSYIFPDPVVKPAR